LYPLEREAFLKVGDDGMSKPKLDRKPIRAHAAPRPVREVPVAGEVPLYGHPEWAREFPWLVQGVTARGEGSQPFDLALFGTGRTYDVLTRWQAFGRACELERIVHGRQVHGSTVRFHEAGPPGLHVAPACDGHATAAPEVLLTVGLADCVGASLVDPVRRAVALLHCGWRGTAAGVLERGIEVLAERTDSDPADLHLHLGPAICGECYEVGPEVHRALGLEAPPAPRPVDLRGALARRAVDAGVDPSRITVSEHCTRCGGSPFFSHRGGDAERHQSFLGIRG
jgi:YfiH family protein